MLIYRIENKDGLGPYRTHNKLIETLCDNEITLTPTQEDWYGPRMKFGRFEGLDRCFGPNEDVYFGFESLDSLLAWFGPVLFRLNQLHYSIVTYEIPETEVLRGDNQVMFRKTGNIVDKYELSEFVDIADTTIVYTLMNKALGTPTNILELEPINSHRFSYFNDGIKFKNHFPQYLFHRGFDTLEQLDAWFGDDVDILEENGMEVWPYEVHSSMLLRGGHQVLFIWEASVPAGPPQPVRKALAKVSRIQEIRKELNKPVSDLNRNLESLYVR